MADGSHFAYEVRALIRVALFTVRSDSALSFCYLATSARLPKQDALKLSTAYKPTCLR